MSASPQGDAVVVGPYTSIQISNLNVQCLYGVTKHRVNQQRNLVNITLNFLFVLKLKLAYSQQVRRYLGNMR
nr:unnamed protein product [Callosobruchus chinensis]